MAEELRGHPFYACVGFHPRSQSKGEWTDEFGRVNSSPEGRGGTHTGLSVALLAGDRIGAPAFCSRIVDFLTLTLEDANPAFVRVEHRNFSESTDLEAALRRNQRKSLRESREYLRGCSWTTGVPDELAGRLGGRKRLEATGAFHRVFKMLAPVLPPGIPQEDPAHPDMRLVLEDASGA